jgi:hypothetical protein
MNVADDLATSKVVLFLHFLYLVYHGPIVQRGTSKRFISDNNMNGKCTRLVKCSYFFYHDGAAEVEWITHHKDFSKFQAMPAR